MPLLKPPEATITHRKCYLRIEESLAQTMERYAEFLGTASIDHVVSTGSAIHLQTRQPVQIVAGAEPRTTSKASQAKGQLQQSSLGWRCTVIQRVLASKGLVAYVLACATGITLYFRWPFPENDLMLHLIAIRAPLI